MMGLVFGIIFSVEQYMMVEHNTWFAVLNSRLHDMAICNQIAKSVFFALAPLSRRNGQPFFGNNDYKARTLSLVCRQCGYLRWCYVLYVFACQTSHFAHELQKLRKLQRG